MTTDSTPLNASGALVPPPAVSNRGWIPPADENPWEELAELRADHLRLLDARREASAERKEAEDELKSLDARREQAVKNAYLDDEEQTDPKAYQAERKK